MRVVYARSIIPLQTLTGKQRRLAHLGNRPLGGFLFSCPSMQREQAQLAAIQAGDEIYERAVDLAGVHPEYLWARRSIFRLADKPLIVSEIFLPAIQQVSTASS